MMDAAFPVEAVLQTGAAETRYRRAGRGAPVLLLSGSAEADALAARLFDELARWCRVIEPVLPAGWRRLTAADGTDGAAADDGTAAEDEAAAADVTAAAVWLRDLIDGLGLDRPSIVVDAALAGELVTAARTDGGRLHRVVVFARTGESEIATRCAQGMRDTGRRVLLLPCESGEVTGPVIERLRSFLARAEDD